MTPHFAYLEAVRTSTGLANTPAPEIAANIGVTAMRMEDVRYLLGQAVIVSSWFRSEPVNKAVGGSETSDHMRGLAVDFTCPKFGTPYRVASFLKDRIKYDQLILEGTWVHIGFGPKWRLQCLTYRGKGIYLPGLVQ